MIFNLPFICFCSFLIFCLPLEFLEIEKVAQNIILNTEINIETQTLTSSSSSLWSSSSSSPLNHHVTTNQPEMNLSNSFRSHFDITVPDGYLVFNPQCKMPSLDPHAKDVMRLFRQEKYESCTKTKPFTSIEMNWDTAEATLVLDAKAIAKNMSCCYQEIERAGKGKSADAQFKLVQNIYRTFFSRLIRIIRLFSSFR